MTVFINPLERIEQLMQRIEHLEAALDEIRLTSMSDAIINIAIAALHGRSTLETFVEPGK